MNESKKIYHRLLMAMETTHEAKQICHGLFALESIDQEREEMINFCEDILLTTQWLITELKTGRKTIK